MQQAHNIYLTKFQQQSLYMGAKDERVIAARRVGKTDGLVAPYVWTASNSMPGMLGAWVAVSRQQGFGKTIPSVGGRGWRDVPTHTPSHRAGLHILPMPRSRRPQLSVIGT